MWEAKLLTLVIIFKSGTLVIFLGIIFLVLILLVVGLLGLPLTKLPTLVVASKFILLLVVLEKKQLELIFLCILDSEIELLKILKPECFLELGSVLVLIYLASLLDINKVFSEIEYF